jgi:ligand-binding sensor domain-containing protein/putative methionine-R-sulfoxide reductase with GAF domain/anti-sigma regulatory factor (Ser/Thr protein kinase)
VALYYKSFFSFLGFCFLLLIKTGAQPLSFHHVNTSDGLSENNVRSVAIDKSGYLWIGTVDGLNVYDGYAVRSFKKDNYPEMASNDVIHLTCDSKNRIWFGSYEGVTWLDEKRKFHRVVLNDTVSKFGCRTIMDTKTYGPVLFTSLGQFFFNEKTNDWEKLTWIPDYLKYQRFSDAEPFDENRIIYATDSLVMLVDYASNKVVYDQPFTSVFSICRYSDHELAIGLQHGKVQIVDFQKKQIVKDYLLTSELNKKMIRSTITEVRPAANGSIVVATDYTGIFIIDRSGNISNYKHDAIDKNSLGANTTWRVLGGQNGDVVVGSNSAGVSIFNIYNKQAGYKRIFNDGQGNYYDTYVAKMTEDKNGVIWIGALERLIRWDKANNTTKFFYYYSAPRESGPQSLEIRSVCIDKQGRVWVSALGEGVAILNEATGQFKKLLRDTLLGPALKSNLILDLYTASDGYIWAGTTSGLYTIHPLTLKVNSFAGHPLLKKLAGIRVNTFLEDKEGNMWIGTHNGVYCYKPSQNRLDNFTSKDGLVSNQCYTLFEDDKGRIYAGSLRGFSIIANGTIKTYNKTNGLKYDYCEGITQDNRGKIWIANTKCIVRFDPEKGNMKYFDENSGLTTDGFRVGSYLKSRTGELFWGSRTGINYFYPDQLINRPADLKVNIYQADLENSILNLGSNEDLSIKYRDNSIVFRFAAINLRGSRNIQYQYKMENHDKEWQTGVDIRQARYSSLPAGKYQFKVKASMDGGNWISASNIVNLTIIPPLWQQWWFVGGILALIIGFIYWIITNRNKKILQQREEIETEQAINYFASSMSEQQSVENILWDVAKNCIGRLHFEDCVIYLMDEERNVLVQKAAHGPKSPREFEITRPMGIELGKGIVGSVALSGKAEVIPDTTKDRRYIVDDEQRLSEISVPIVSDGKVLGVIDCEHSKKGFFTQKHLSILTTIASLCANKIVRAKAEEEKREAQMILMSTQQKMTEVEMQALRAQMNPHFIFNCLNSINRYIVKSDQTTASLYLTKFAKLIRLILDNSNSKNVVLTNELEALKLYIEMEALRFDKKFTYEIKVENRVGADTIEVPPLIIQPYVENAIWHGLLHKESNGHLSIRVCMCNETMLECIIEDNGIGREKAKELKSKTATSRKSLGMRLTENRLSLLNKHAALNASVEIIDLQNGGNEALGTKVILKIPV